MISSVEVVEEAARLIKQIRFSANRPAYREGQHAAVSVDPRWSDDNRTIDVVITCYALGQAVDWEGLRINIERREAERSVTWLSFLNARGQAARNELPVGEAYALTMPYRVRSQIAERVLPQQIRSRASVQLSYDPENLESRSGDEDVSDPVVREGRSFDGAILWTVKESAQGVVELLFEATDELPGRRVAISLVESTTGRVQYSAVVALVSAGTAAKFEGRVLIDASAGITRPCDLVFESLLPDHNEST